MLKTPPECSIATSASKKNPAAGEPTPDHLAGGVNMSSMKISLIGGVSVENSDPLYTKQEADLDGSMAELGRATARAGHDLLVCSPFEDSADASAAVSALKTVADSNFGSDVEFHHPDAAAVVAQMRAFMGRFPK
jgi:hypothetical protein